MPPKPPKSKFRFHAKKFGLTYSCPIDAEDNPVPSSEKLLEFLESKVGAGKYIIAEEKHESGKRHYHVYYHADAKVQTENVRFFDWPHTPDPVHPNIINKPGNGWMSYCKKDKVYISNFEKGNFATAMELPTADEALEFLWNKEPREMLRFANTIESNMRKRKRSVFKAPIYLGPYPKHYYDFECNMQSHSLLLWGPPNQHKTQFARYLMAHTVGDYVFLKKNPEQLKTSPGVPFIFDEVYMHNHDPNDSREITDVENGGSVHARNSNAEIPPGVPRLFTSNYQFPFKNPNDSVYERRVVSKYISYEGPVPAI